jgi:hypothetical protein
MNNMFILENGLVGSFILDFVSICLSFCELKLNNFLR